jgi:hypothetical protein
MKYPVETVLCGIISVPNFIKTGSGFQKLLGGIHKHTDSMGIP